MTERIRTFKTTISGRLLPILVAVMLLHGQMAFSGCDLPMFAGARMFAAGGGNAGMFVTADFNHDGILDLAVISNTAGNVAILLGNGDGTFQPAQAVAKGKPQALAAADFNGDGNIDLAVSDGNSFEIVMLLGNGDGTFRSPIVAGGQSATAMAVGDFNKDGKPDLAISGLPAYILLGNGDGTFGPLITPGGDLSVPGEGVDVGDFNGDGKLDVATGGPSGLTVMLGDGTGHLTAPVVMSAGAVGTTTVKVADVNGDHTPDLLSFDPFGSNMIVILGNGNGTFQAPVNYPIPAQLVAAANLVVADLTGDGIPDMVISAQPPVPSSSFGVQTGAGTIFVYPGVGDGTFQAPVLYNSGYYVIWWMAAGDFNGDGLPDLVFSDTTNNSSAPTQVGILLGNPNGTLQGPNTYAVTDTPRTPVLADFNGDGVLDMAVVNTGFFKPGLSVLLGNPDGTFQPATNYSTSFGPQAVAAGDMNGDGKIDLVVADTNNLLTYLGNGDGTFQAPISSGAGFGAYHVVLGDFNGDGKLDAAVGSAVGVQIYNGNGNGGFGNSSFPIMSCVGCNGKLLAVADLNGDGRLDLVVPNSDYTTPNGLSGGGTVTAFLGNGNGSFQNGVSYTAGLNAVFVAVGDFNGDGHPDLAVADLGGNQINQSNPGALAVLLGNGDGTFQKAVRYAAPLGSSWVATGDFNGDGYSDVAVAGLTKDTVATVTVFLSNSDGTLRNVLTYGAGASPIGITMGDVNGDGRPDLVYVDDTSNLVGVMLNSYIPGSTGSACVAAPLASQ